MSFVVRSKRPTVFEGVGVFLTVGTQRKTPNTITLQPPPVAVLRVGTEMDMKQRLRKAILTRLP